MTVFLYFKVMKFTDEFKEAILQLPEKEKDKLLLRLLKKDIVLVNRLNFELLQPCSVEDARSAVEEKIKVNINRLVSTKYAGNVYMMELRYMSGAISEHVSTTKDKYGEVYLQLIMLDEFLSKMNSQLTNYSNNTTEKLYKYIIAKLFKLLITIKGMHEDLRYDFRDSLENISSLMGENPNLMHLSIYHGLDMNWLIDLNIPENIADIHKDLRAKGYLR